MRRLFVLLVAAVTLSLALPAGAAFASSTTKRDPDDAADLDLKSVTLKTKRNKIVATITTYDRIRDADLQMPSGLAVDFKVGKRKVRGMPVRITDSGRLFGRICTYRGFDDVSPSNCSRLPASRVGTKAVRVVVPKKKIDKGARTLRWGVGSFVQTSGSVDSIPPKKGRYFTWRL